MNESLSRRAGRLLAMVTGVSGDVRRDIELAGVLQRPLTRPARIVVVGARNGVGRTTSARLLARMYAHFRRDRVLLVNSTQSRQSPPSNGFPDSFDAIRSYLKVSDGGLWMLPGAGDQAMLATLARHFALTIVDARAPSYDLIAGSNALLLVTEATSRGLADAQWRLSWLETQNLPDIRSRTIAVYVQRDPDGARELQPQMRSVGCFGVGMLPYDEQLADHRGAVPHLSAWTWSAALGIASDTLTLAGEHI